MNHSSQNQDGELTGKTKSKDYIKKHLPKPRKQKIVWIIVCIAFAIGTLFYAIKYDTEEMFLEDNDLCTKKTQLLTNSTTDTCYRKVEKETHPIFFEFLLGLLGLILGQFIYFLCNMLEELRQFKRRYNRNIFEVYKQCMTGISWKPAIAVGVIIVVVVGFLRGFKERDLLYILCGIGLRLFTYLLNLNLQTGVDCSRHREENMQYPAYTLAWDYYIHRVRKMLPAFIKRFRNSNTPVQDQDQGSSEHSDRDTHPKIQLTSKKLILLVSQRYNENVMLVDLDDRIEEITRISEGGYEFPLYSLKHNGKDYQYVIKFADEPLEILQLMCKSEECKSVHKDQLEEQVKLLFKTLSEMLMNDGFYKSMCTFVLITEVDSLQNGGLVNIIMSQVGEEKCESNTEKTPIRTRAQQNLVPCKSVIVNIDETERRDNEEKSDTDGFFIPDDLEDDASAFFGEDKRDKNPLNRKLRRKNKAKMKGKQCESVPLVPYPDKNTKNMNIETKNTQSTSSKEQEKEDGGETTSPRHRTGEQPQPTSNDVVPITSLDTSTLPLQPKNEERSDQDVECQNETEDDEISGAKSDLINEEGSPKEI